MDNDALQLALHYNQPTTLQTDTVVDNFIQKTSTTTTTTSPFNQATPHKYSLFIFLGIFFQWPSGIYFSLSHAKPRLPPTLPSSLRTYKNPKIILFWEHGLICPFAYMCILYLFIHIYSYTKFSLHFYTKKGKKEKKKNSIWYAHCIPTSRDLNKHPFCITYLSALIHLYIYLIQKNYFFCYYSEQTLEKWNFLFSLTKRRTICM